MKWSIVCALSALLFQVRGHPALTNPHIPPNTYCQCVGEEMQMDHCLEKAQLQLEKNGTMLQSFGKLYKGCLVSLAQTIDFMRKMCEERTVACKAKCLEVDDMRSCLEKCAKERAELKYQLMKANRQGGYPMVMEIHQSDRSEIKKQPETKEKKDVVDDKPSENRSLPEKQKNIPDGGMQGSPEKKMEVEKQTTIQANASQKATENRGNDENQNHGNSQGNQNQGNPHDNQNHGNPNGNQNHGNSHGNQNHGDPQGNQNHGNPNGNRDEKPLKDEDKNKTSKNNLIDKINLALEMMNEGPEKNHRNLDRESHDSRPVDHESRNNNQDNEIRPVENGNDKENSKQEDSADNKDNNNADRPLPLFVY